MTAPADIASAIDRFLSTEKRAVGVEQPIAWVPGFNEHEMVIYVPLEIDGEQTGSKLMIVGFPLAQSLKFRIGVLFPGAVCRLDFTDETSLQQPRYRCGRHPWDCSRSSLSFLAPE